MKKPKFKNGSEIHCSINHAFGGGHSDLGHTNNALSSKKSNIYSSLCSSDKPLRDFQCGNSNTYVLLI